MAVPAVQFDRVTHSFDRRSGSVESGQVLRDMNVQVPSGQFVCLVGKTGCGKTTMLNLIAGLIRPTEGRIEIFGSTVELARSRLSYMFARDALMPWRSAAQNVELVLELRKVPREVRQKRAVAELERVGLAKYVKAYPGQLSQGMRQRVALARTWAIDPDLALMDEPFAALDAQTRAALQEELTRMWLASNRTIIFVTHDLVEAILLADRVLVIRQGAVALDQGISFLRPRTLDNLTDDPEFHDLHRRLREALG